ncbi:MAG: OmpA family protein [Bacteroidaceae bacterium]|nr:OmpA family protein [Bacteroidaceae bacterium]
MKIVTTRSNGMAKMLMVVFLLMCGLMVSAQTDGSSKNADKERARAEEYALKVAEQRLKNEMKMQMKQEAERASAAAKAKKAAKKAAKAEKKLAKAEAKASKKIAKAEAEAAKAKAKGDTKAVAKAEKKAAEIAEKLSDKKQEVEVVTARPATPTEVARATYTYMQPAVVENKNKHKHGDWFYGLGFGFSQSLAENAKGEDFITHQMPSFDLLFGHNFSPVFGFKVTGSLNMQVSRCSEAAVKAMPEIYGNGRYSYRLISGSMSGILNLTNAFFGYDVNRPMTWSLVFGAGMIKTFNFETDKLALWNRTPTAEKPYYPVDGDGGNYVVGHAGFQIDVRLNEPWDLSIDLRANATDNKYNGVSNGNNIDFYVDLMVNFVYHFTNGKQKLRRFREPPKKAFVDPVLIDNTRTYRETVRYGESMYTEIPFYAGFYYLNTASSKRLDYVARFLKEHPLVNVNIVGHPDIIPDDDEEYHRVLAQKRAEVVREALITKYQIDPTRLRTSHVEKALQPFKTLREWVPAVNFIMEDPGSEIPSSDKD